MPTGSALDLQLEYQRQKARSNAAEGLVIPPYLQECSSGVREQIEHFRAAADGPSPARLAGRRAHLSRRRARDTPVNAAENGVVNYHPNQTGVYRVRNEIAASFAANANWWNSGHREYRRARVPGKARIVIVGDSFAEGFQVAYDRSVDERLEQAVGPDRMEVYRFGISGAPLSHVVVHKLRLDDDGIAELPPQPLRQPGSPG